MVHMAVGVDDGVHWLVGPVGIVEVKSGLGVFCGNQGIDDYQPRVTFDDGHIGDVGIAYLINTITDFEESIEHDQARLSPKAGIHRIWCCLGIAT